MKDHVKEKLGEVNFRETFLVESGNAAYFTSEQDLISVEKIF